MRLREVRDILDAEVLWGEKYLDEEIAAACGSDFMSDVLAHTKEQALLLTGLVNPQVIRTAEMVDMKCVVFVRGKIPSREILQMAEDRKIVVMTSQCRLFIACGRLYANGLTGG